MRVTNKEFMRDTLFIESCRLANIEPTKRQASKFRRKVGLAYSKRQEARAILKHTKQQ